MLLIAILAINQGLGLEIGVLRRIGPGFMPLLLGILALGFSVALLFANEAEPVDIAILKVLPPFLWVGASFVAFALLIDRAGLVPAVMATIFLASYSDREVKFMHVLFLAIGMASFTAVVFRFGLKLPLPLVVGW